MPTFSHVFCEQYEIDPERYLDAMFWRCLHRRARPFVFVLRVVDPEYFRPDYELIQGVGALSSGRYLGDELANFNFHPANHGLLRRRLKLRVSGRRVSRLVTELLAEKHHALVATEPFLR